MAKLDKSQYSKEEWRKIREQRRYEKELDRIKKENKERLQQQSVLTQEQQRVIPRKPVNRKFDCKTAFVLGNGTSRKDIIPEEIKPYGKIYGCNALYREFEPDFLIAVDVKMILEINKAGYQHTHEVWTNPNKAYHAMKNINFFHPSKGWSSGPTALWLASQHQYERVFILGFDYKGLDDGKKLNNIYADTRNYKKSTEGATFFGNWLRQTVSVVKERPNINFYRVITPDNYIPDELNKFDNLKHIYVEDFKKMFNLS